MTITQQNLPQIRHVFREKDGNKAGNFAGLELFVILFDSDKYYIKHRVRAGNYRSMGVFGSLIVVANAQQGFQT